MTKEELLKTYLSDSLIKEKNYLEGKDPKDVHWAEQDTSTIVTMLKLVIEGELSSESKNVTVRKINQLLNF